MRRRSRKKAPAGAGARMHFVRLAEGEVDGVVAAGGLELTLGRATESKVNRFDVGIFIVSPHSRYSMYIFRRHA